MEVPSKKNEIGLKILVVQAGVYDNAWEHLTDENTGVQWHYGTPVDPTEYQNEYIVSANFSLTWQSIRQLLLVLNCLFDFNQRMSDSVAHASIKDPSKCQHVCLGLII